MGPFTESDDAFLTASCSALRSGDDALASLGWGDLLPYFDQDRDARKAVFAIFRAQGRELVTTSALATLMAHPYTPATNEKEVPVAAAIEIKSRRGGPRTVVMGRPARGKVLIDRPRRGAGLVDVDAAEFHPIDLPGRLGLHTVDVDINTVAVTIPESEAATLRARSLSLGRVALAFDLLGAAESALALAVEHAGNREQFGQPIGRFQAVRHLLAAARVDCAAVQAVAEQAAMQERCLPAAYDKVVKAVAGRNCRRVCERALQVLGGIGFTTEHPHHHFHSRVLTLDTLLGSATALAHDLAVHSRAAGVPIPAISLTGPTLGSLADLAQ